jgi:hypothetical protein
MWGLGRQEGGRLSGSRRGLNHVSSRFPLGIKKFTFLSISGTNLSSMLYYQPLVE